jgi:hypothetical protein
MENDIFETLSNLNCPFVDSSEQIVDLASDNAKLIQYSHLIEWLSTQLNILCKTDEKIHHIDCKTI